MIYHVILVLGVHHRERNREAKTERQSSRSIETRLERKRKPLWKEETHVSLNKANKKKEKSSRPFNVPTGHQDAQQKLPILTGSGLSYKGHALFFLCHHRVETPVPYRTMNPCFKFIFYIIIIS